MSKNKKNNEEKDEIDEAIEAIFSIYDTDGNGTLDADEAKIFFDELFALVGDSIPPDAHPVIIQQIDANGDGQLSKDELRTIMTEALFKNM